MAATTLIGSVFELVRQLVRAQQSFSSPEVSSSGGTGRTGTGASKVCQSQCNILRSAFACLTEYAAQVEQFTLINRQEGSTVGAELLGSLRRCLQLIRSCEGDEWLITTLLCEDRREDFKAVHSQLYDSIELLSAFLYQASTSAEDKAKVRGAYRKWIENRKNTEGAAANDKRHLMRLSMTEEEDATEEGSALQLLSHMILEKSAPEIDHKQLLLSQHLGQGAFGTVYETIWLSRVFAVKVFTPGETSFRSFQRELAALSSNKHPNVLAIVGFARSDTGHFLVMERMDMDLASLLLRKKLSTLDVINILLQIAKGMAWLHAREVIHRDLKPQNVLVSGENFLRVKIADFGLSRTNFITSQVTYATWKQGTKIFMAPEVWNSEHYSKTSDVYSYAIICYQLLTGRAPYDAETLESSDFMLRVSDGLRPTGEFPSSCPPELVELTRLCWSGDPEDRPQFSEICSQLKLLKSKIITGVHDFTEIRRDLVGSSSSCFGESRTSGSRTSSRPKQKQQGNGKHSSNSGSQGSSGVHSSPSNSYPATQAPQPALHPQAKARKELTVLIRKGKINEAFSYTLSLNDPAAVWWLCSKMEPKLLHAFSQTMVMQIAEQINEDLDVNTNEKISWIAQAVEILMADYKAWGSPRLERFFQRLCESLHGQFALTPRQSEQGEFLRTQLKGAIDWLRRVQTAISNANLRRSFGMR